MAIVGVQWRFGILASESNQVNSCIMSMLVSDNVHFQHSAQLIKALTEADVMFSLQVGAVLNIVHHSCHSAQLTLFPLEAGRNRLSKYDIVEPSAMVKAPTLHHYVLNTTLQ